MPSPKSLLPWLIGGAIGAGGIFQGLHWRSSAAKGNIAGIENQLRIATEENDILKRENESLRSLVQGGGELAVAQEWVDLVEKDLGLRFQSTPVVRRTGGTELRDRISAAIESGFGPAGLDYRQEAWRLIGWLLPDDRLLEQLTAVRWAGAKAWFDDFTGEGWVTDKLVIGDVPDQAVLVRLLARILLHQNFPPPTEYPGDEEARTREALHAGAASGCEERFLANKKASASMTLEEDSEAEQLVASLSPFIQGLTMFPVMEGKTYVDRVKKEKDWIETLKPRTTRTILRQAKDESGPGELKMPAVDGDPFMSESAGELGLRLWLEPLGDVGEAMEIASAWEGDRYVFFPDGETSSAVIWDIVLDSKAAADRIEAVALDLVAAMAGAEESAKIGIPLESLEKRVLVLWRVGPDRVRFVNAARRETAERLGAR